MTGSVNEPPADGHAATHLLDAVNSLEMSALKQGNGFSPTLEEAPLDAANEVTFAPNAELTAKLAAFPPISNFDACLRLIPVMITEVPTVPLAGLKLLICGVTRKARLLVIVAVKVFTVTSPESAPAGTVARM